MTVPGTESTPAEETKSVFFNIRLEPSMHQQLGRLARRNERTLAAEIRMALKRYLDEEKAAA
jgi:predicted DNA-binding protein